jgi:hypothetical protein
LRVITTFGPPNSALLSLLEHLIGWRAGLAARERKLQLALSSFNFAHIQHANFGLFTAFFSFSL